MFKCTGILDTIIAGESAHQLLAHPIVEDTADVFSCDPCHRGEVTLSDFLSYEYAPRAHVFAEGFCEAEKCLCDTTFEREKGHRGDDGIRAAQALHEQR